MLGGVLNLIDWHSICFCEMAKPGLVVHNSYSAGEEKFDLSEKA